jgi:hypothetical protein
MARHRARPAYQLRYVAFIRGRIEPPLDLSFQLLTDGEHAKKEMWAPVSVTPVRCAMRLVMLVLLALYGLGVWYLMRR